MTPLSGLPALSVRRPTLIVVLNLLIVIAGLGAIFGVEVRELPDVDRPTVTVRAYFDGASPETMDAEVTSVIEGAVARVSGVKTINAASEENNARVRATFLSGIDLDVAANDIREAVASIFPEYSFKGLQRLDESERIKETRSTYAISLTGHRKRLFLERSRAEP